MVEVKLFHYRDRNTFLNRMNPLTKIVAVLLCSTVLAGSGITRTVSMAFILAITAWSLRLSIREYRRELRFFIIMGTLIALARLRGTDDVVESVNAALRFGTIVLMGLLFADTTAPDDLSRSIGSALSRIPRVHGNRIGATFELTLATIPLLFDVSAQVAESRRARLESRWKHPLRRIVSYGSAVFSILLERAEDLEAALESRGFDPDASREVLPFGFRDAVLTGTVAVLTISLSCFT